MGKPAKQSLLTLQPLSSLCLFISPAVDSSKASEVTSPRDFLGGSCQSTMLWGFQDVLYVLKDTGGKETGAGETCCSGLAIPSPDKETHESCGARPVSSHSVILI